MNRSKLSQYQYRDKGIVKYGKVWYDKNAIFTKPNKNNLKRYSNTYALRKNRG